MYWKEICEHTFKQIGYYREWQVFCLFSHVVTGFTIILAYIYIKKLLPKRINIFIHTKKDI
jgi:hypothetical protein